MKFKMEMEVNNLIYTVTGPVKKEELGVTLSHEHIAWDSQDAEKLYFDRVYDEEKVDYLYNKLLPIFKKLYISGCRSIAESSTPAGGQNLKLMQRLSKESGIKLIANTGEIFSENIYKIHNTNYAEEVAKRWIEDFENGLDTIDDVVIRPSHIKLFTSRGKLPENEKQILGAAVIASKATGMPIHCHILEAQTAEEVFETLIREKCDFTKFLWAHAGKEGNIEAIEKAAAVGMWLGFDIIRSDNYEMYCSLIKRAIEKGYEDRILLSQDYDFYEQISEHGDKHPCASLFTDFLPYCEKKGLSREILINLLTKNPAAFYNTTRDARDIY